MNELASISNLNFQILLHRNAKPLLEFLVEHFVVGKVLGLDHHFSSVRTFSEISKISNPTQYPNSYQNQTQCESKLPLEYGKLKADINIAIDKFNVAYKPVEVNGSKMKEILYGINEFQ